MDGMDTVVERGCGFREPGGVYAVTPLGKRGRPIEEFLIDPALPVAEVLGSDDALPARGVLMQQAGPEASAWHIFDRVGSEHYPNVVDFVEEVRRHGLSRRLPSGPGLAKIGPGSLILLAHERAVIQNARDYYQALEVELAIYGSARGLQCPQGKHELAEVIRQEMQQTCAGLWWEDLDGDQWDTLLDPELPPRAVGRGMPVQSPAWQYLGRHRPEGVKPSYANGFFLRLPIHHLEVINDPEGGLHEATLERAELSGLEVRMVDQ